MRVKIEMPLQAYGLVQSNKTITEQIKLQAVALPKDMQKIVTNLADMYIDLANAIDACVVEDDKCVMGDDNE
jgi:hypothetical protein